MRFNDLAVWYGLCYILVYVQGRQRLDKVKMHTAHRGAEKSNRENELISDREGPVVK